MSDYPSSSPWGPHGPQVNVPSVTPNPTAPSPPPSFAAPDPWPVSAPATGGGGVAAGGGVGAVSGTPGVAIAPIGPWVRKLAMAGLVVGCLLGFGGSMTTHLLPTPIGVLRFGLAGAAVGASIPPAVRAAALASRALIWIVITGLLWAAAFGLAGQTGWLTSLR